MQNSLEHLEKDGLDDATAELQLYTHLLTSMSERESTEEFW